MEYNIYNLYNFIKNNGVDAGDEEGVLTMYLNDIRFRKVVNDGEITYHDYINWTTFEDMINRRIEYEAFAKMDTIIWDMEGIALIDLIN